MTVLLYLIPAAILLGLLGLAAFLWAMRTGQFDDLDGAAHRILFDDDGPPPGDAADPHRASPAEGGDDRPGDDAGTGPPR